MTDLVLEQGEPLPYFRTFKNWAQYKTPPVDNPAFINALRALKIRCPKCIASRETWCKQPDGVTDAAVLHRARLRSAPPFSAMDFQTDILLEKLRGVGLDRVTLLAQTVKLREEVDEVLELSEMDPEYVQPNEILKELVDVVIVCNTAARVLGFDWGTLVAGVEAKAARNAERDWFPTANGTARHTPEGVLAYPQIVLSARTDEHGNTPDEAWGYVIPAMIDAVRSECPGAITWAYMGAGPILVQEDRYLRFTGGRADGCITTQMGLIQGNGYLSAKLTLVRESSYPLDQAIQASAQWLRDGA